MITDQPPTDEQTSDTYRLTRDDRERLLECLKSKFSFNDLQEIGFELGVSYEVNRDIEKAKYALDLLEYFIHRDQLYTLVSKIQSKRPNVSLVDILNKLSPPPKYIKVEIIFPHEESLDLEVLRNVIFRETGTEPTIVASAYGSVRLLIAVPEYVAEQLRLDHTDWLSGLEVKIRPYDDLNFFERRAWKEIALNYPPSYSGNNLIPTIRWKTILSRYVVFTAIATLFILLALWLTWKAVQSSLNAAPSGSDNLPTSTAVGTISPNKGTPISSYGATVNLTDTPWPSNTHTLPPLTDTPIVTDMLPPTIAADTTSTINPFSLIPQPVLHFPFEEQSKGPAPLYVIFLASDNNLGNIYSDRQEYIWDFGGAYYELVPKDERTFPDSPNAPEVIFYSAGNYLITVKICNQNSLCGEARAVVSVQE
jgi:hypothetical protein